MRTDAKPIASIPLMGGVTRPVYLDADGRQYVLDDNSRPVHGVWVYIDEPMIVDAIMESAGSSPAGCS